VCAFHLAHAVMQSSFISACVLSFRRFLPFDRLEVLIIIMTLGVIKGKCISQ